MIAFANNRLVNGLQLENAIALLAGGVSERLSQYLHAIGLSTSRWAAIRAMARLAKVGLSILRRRLSHDYPIRPLLILDNFDIQESIHYSRVEADTRMFHGTYGYIHFLSDSLTLKVPPKDLTLKSLVEAMRKAETMDVDVKHLLPTIPERAHWKETIKAQLGQAYLNYVVTNNRTITPEKKNQTWLVNHHRLSQYSRKKLTWPCYL